jgi:hypothetical protein
MEWALWHQFSHIGDQHRSPTPLTFRNRIKKLLDLDKADDDPIFHARGSQGHAHQYQEFGVFLMWLGLTFLDAGFKQGDVLFLLRHIKTPLREPFDHIVESPPSPGQMDFHSSRPKSPPHPSRPNHADCSVFLLIRKIELRECWKWDTNEAFIFGPKFCYGLTALQAEMDRLNFEYPSTMVIELADTVVMLNAHLKNAPTPIRGRKSKKSNDQMAAERP